VRRKKLKKKKSKKQEARKREAMGRGEKEGRRTEKREESREILFHQSRSPLEYKRYLNRLTTKPWRMLISWLT
jgi:hypothetical protein